MIAFTCQEAKKGIGAALSYSVKDIFNSIGLRRLIVVETMYFPWKVFRERDGCFFCSVDSRPKRKVTSCGDTQ